MSGDHPLLNSRQLFFHQTPLGLECLQLPASLHASPLHWIHSTIHISVKYPRIKHLVFEFACCFWVAPSLIQTVDCIWVVFQTAVEPVWLARMRERDDGKRQDQ